MIVFYKFLFPLLLLSSNLIDNDKKELVLELNINNKNITLNNSYENININIFKINKLKFYISNLKFYLKGKEVLEYHKKHILIDIENENSLKILIPNKLRFDEITFNLGVDEETNKSGAKGGDLDPINGMYWTWNSGYIISNLKFYLKDKEVLEYHKKHILIDIENENSLKILIPNKLRFDEITFNLGVDEETNKSGAKGGDLDPINGMYWTWNSGYINFKAEGVYKGSNDFSYHIGGFMKPYDTIQLIKMNFHSLNENKIVLNFDEFFNKIDFSLSEILSPGENAVKLSTLLANSIN